VAARALLQLGAQTLLDLVGGLRTAVLQLSSLAGVTVPNRRGALARLGEEIARAQRAHPPVSCLMLDIDNLKQINDTFGHLDGDRVLREAGASLRAELRAYDVAARYGGDEFVVLLPATEQHAAFQAGARMTAAVARIEFPANGTAPIPVAVTFGAATSRPDEVPDALLQRADQALLNVKRRTHTSRPPSEETQVDA
jgi:two-component system, cell cycle response regulator